MKRQSILLSLILSACAFSARAETASFIFDAQSIRHSSKPQLTLRIGEKTSVKELKKRFAGYNVIYTGYQDDNECPCVEIFDTEDSFFIQLDDGNVIRAIASSDETDRDASGNAIGDPLSKVIGSTTALCREGSESVPMCASQNLKGLWYYVDIFDDECQPEFKDGQPLPQTINIPACTTISSFSIENPEQRRALSDPGDIVRFACGRHPLILDFHRSALTFKGTEYKALRAVENFTGFDEWKTDGVSVGMDNGGGAVIQIAGKAGVVKYDCRFVN